MITVEQIHDIEKERKKRKKEMYMKIYEQFNKKIKNAVEMNQKQVFLKVPPFVLGYPSYNVKAAADYLERQLRNGGFSVSRLNFNEIYITWGKSSQNRERKQQEPDDDLGLPHLMNLKKLANKLRN